MEKINSIVNFLHLADAFFLKNFYIPAVEMEVIEFYAEFIQF